MFLAPPLSIGACSVQEMFSAHERGQKVGIWGKSYAIKKNESLVTDVFVKH
jgi:hypothetical protein